jgi:hypothetical protein
MTAFLHVSGSLAMPRLTIKPPIYMERPVMQDVEDKIDVTDDVSVYEHGKTFECKCGQGFGVMYEEHVVKCPTCGKHCIDKKAKQRDYSELKDGDNNDDSQITGQAGLGDF